MNSLTTLPFYFYLNNSRPSSKFTPPQLSFSKRRRSRRPKRTHPFSDKHNPTSLNPSLYHDNVNFVLDVNQISIISSSKSKLHDFLSAAEEAWTDLRSVVRVDDEGRLLVSCRRSTIQFVAGLSLAGFVLVLVFKVLVKLGLGFRSRFGVANQSIVVRRDRSLGGREVVVATRDDVVYRNSPTPSKALKNPLSPGSSFGLPTRVPDNFRAVRTVNKLPKWWPYVPEEAAEDRTLVVDKEEYKRDANRLICAIIDQRTRGLDVMEDDIIQLRRICRTSGVRVSIDTTNTRDSLYRTSVDFVLNVCSRAPSYSTSVLIDGEDVRHFVAGLADNIGLENVRAARMVSAAVAARTRSRFLQSWALEMQGDHSGALLELSMICLVHRIFPPEESSPEMEMVARGLEKLLKLEHREFIMNMLVSVCSEECHKSAAEALGLVFSPEGTVDQHETSIHEN